MKHLNDYSSTILLPMLHDCNHFLIRVHGIEWLHGLCSQCLACVQLTIVNVSKDCFHHWDTSRRCNNQPHVVAGVRLCKLPVVKSDFVHAIADVTTSHEFGVICGG